MDPNNPQDIPPVKVRVHDTAPQHAQPGDNQTIAIEAIEQANRTHSRRVPGWVPMSALAAVLAVLAGTLWWSVARNQGENPRARAGIPSDVIALINSSTPLPTAAPGGPKDTVGELSYRPQSDGWSAALREAYRAMEEGRYSAAISQFSALVGDGSGAESREALWGLASAHWQGGQPEPAIRAYTIFSQLDDPRSARALARIAHIYEQRGQEQSAAIWVMAGPRTLEEATTLPWAAPPRPSDRAPGAPPRRWNDHAPARMRFLPRASENYSFPPGLRRRL